MTRKLFGKRISKRLELEINKYVSEDECMILPVVGLFSRSYYSSVELHLIFAFLRWQFEAIFTLERKLKTQNA